jgi:tRNA pseudouridine55 synthase
VEIKEIRVLGWYEGDYPELNVAIACGTGTYIRSIARDLGEKLGCGATLSGLVRTYSNGFDLDASLTFEQVAELVKSNNLKVLAPDRGLHFLPVVSLDVDRTKRWCMGQAIAMPEGLPSSQYARIYDSEQEFLGLSEIIEAGLKPIVVLKPIN